MHLPCNQDSKNQTQLPGKAAKSAVELAIDQAADLAHCTICASDPPHASLCNPNPFYGSSASRLGSIKTIQTGKLSASPVQMKPTNFHISRLSLDSAWSTDDNYPSSSPHRRPSFSPPPSPMPPSSFSLMRSNVAIRFPLDTQLGKPEISSGHASPQFLPSTLSHLENNIKHESKQACKPAQH